MASSTAIIFLLHRIRYGEKYFIVASLYNWAQFCYDELKSATVVSLQWKILQLQRNSPLNNNSRNLEIILILQHTF